MAPGFRPDTIVGDIYDAAVAPDGLQRLAAIVMKIADAGSVQIGVARENGVREAATCNLPDEALQRYVAYYHRVDPVAPIAIARRAFHVMRYTNVFAASDLQRTEFYTDFMRVYDTVRVIGMPLAPVDASCSLEIGLHRGAKSRDFSNRDVSRVQNLLPSLRRAVQLRQRLALGLDPNIGLAVLERLAFGCVVCDSNGGVLFANQAALALEAAGRIVLAASRHGLSAPDAAQSRQLAALIAGTAAGGSGGAIALAADDGARLFALVTPLPRRVGHWPGHVLVTLRSEASDPPFDAEKLRMLFGLTPAEARLALALAAGRSLAEIGAALGVSENTLRTQIASVLRKTDTASQRELVRILNLPPPLR